MNLQETKPLDVNTGPRLLAVITVNFSRLSLFLHGYTGHISDERDDTVAQFAIFDGGNGLHNVKVFIGVTGCLISQTVKEVRRR